ncbi:DUF5606 family protein [Flavobacterium silvaticum]|uniref:DUF5606 domain-containing protein n=1 Tax=Flavobacterium silvaticum TaxID=1852020 RepID=A0A972G2E1_9FLAO|nr:DUF5606 domain-containing protein [Flavobacterium silvaticum]NMH29211.1 DUF5606 domain-containing protein [Flavobacterium silvaticum]
MNVDKILAISGKPGLYELKIQTRTGFVAESLLDGKKVTVGLRNNVSLLSEISMYSVSGEKPLSEVMRSIAKKENEGPALSPKSDNAELLSYFGEVFPDFDQDRVYPSDIKKVLSWYNILQAKGMVSKEEPVAAEAPKAEEAAVVEEKPVKAKKAKTEETAEAPKPKAKTKKKE